VIGYQRCVQYVRHIHPEYNESQVAKAVYEHYLEKLSHLVESFMRTPGGIRRGEEATDTLRVLVFAALA